MQNDREKVDLKSARRNNEVTGPELEADRSQNKMHMKNVCFRVTERFKFSVYANKSKLQSFL